MKKTIIWIIIAVLLIVLAVLGYMVLTREIAPENPALDDFKQNEPTKDSEETNKSSSPTADYRDFTVYTYEGDSVSLSEIADQAKPVVINFWTTWCGYCKEEMPDFNEVYKEYSDKVNFMMIDVNGNGNDNMEEAYAYVEESGFEFPVYYDTDLSAATAYGLTSFPTTVVLNSEGVTIYAYPGMMSKQNLLSLIEKALETSNK